MTKSKLNAKRRRFCQEFVVNCNATQAAIRAGYSEHTAREQGAFLFSLVIIRDCIAELQKKIAKKTELSAEYVLTGLMSVHQRCIQAEPVMDREGKETGEYRFNASGANRSLELLGKHLELFTDKVEHSVSGTLAEALARLDKNNEANPSPKG